MRVEAAPGLWISLPDDATDAEIQQAADDAVASSKPKPKQPVPAKSLPTPTSAAMSAAGGALRDLAAGAVRGAGSIGATLVSPGDYLADLTFGKGKESRNEQRRKNIDRGLRTMTGANPESIQYKVGKIGGEVAGTLGLPVAIGGKVASVAPKLGAAITSGGMNAQGASLLPRTVGGAIGGGASAALVDPEQAGTGAVIGGLLPGGAVLAGKAGAAIREVARGPEVAPSIRQAFEEGRAVGYVAPPTQVRPSMANRILEGMSQKGAIGQEASIRNQVVTDKLVNRALGLPDDTVLSVDVLNGIRRNAGKAYDAIGSTGKVVPGKPYEDALNKIIEPHKNAAKGFPNAKPPELVQRIDELRTPEFDAAAGIAKIKELRDAADAAGRAGDKATAKAYKNAADAIEDAIDRHLRGIHAPAEMLKAFRDARQTIAKTYTVEKALTSPEGGSVDAAKLAAQLRKGKPLTGELKTVARFAAEIPKAVQLPQKIGGRPGTTLMDLLIGAGGYGATQNPLMLAGVAARPLIRTGLLSNVAQNRLARPQSDGLLAMLANDPEAMALLARTTPAAASGLNRQ